MAPTSLPITKPEHDQYCSESTKPLLSSKPSDSSTNAHYKLLYCVAFVTLLVTCIILLVASPLGSNVLPSHLSAELLARPPKQLKKDVVILISSDGFRFGYQFKTETPNIDELIAKGTEAERGLIPVFPTMTFPNHYSIATGLYPTDHGIIMNSFYNPRTNKSFTTKTGSREPEWWLGEPLWVTVEKNNLKAATFFWPGSEAPKGPWTCPEGFCQHYNGSVPFEDRVDKVLSYFDTSKYAEPPSFITLYLEDPDSQGHKVGPDDPRITKAVARVDKMIGRLTDGLKAKGTFEDVHIIMVGDHGMVGNCDEKMISLDDLAPWIEIPADWVQFYTPVLAIRPPWDKSPPHVAAERNAEVVRKINEGLSSGKVKNGEYLKVYLKEDLPARLHYSSGSAGYLIPPIIGLVEEGFKVNQTRTGVQDCGGAHGYDNAFFSMRTIFIGHGPRFARGRKVPSFMNVEIYNLVTSILNIRGAPNSGTKEFKETILLPPK